MADEYRVVDVWVGQFPTEGAFEGYLRETYREDDDDSPITQFAADMGETFYDHDLTEAAYHEVPSNDLATLIEDHSFASSYAREVMAAYQRSAPGAVNVVILVWGREIERPRSVEGVGYSLRYLGQFDCDPKA